MQLIKDTIDFNAYREEPETHKVRPASDFLAETIAAFYPPAGAAVSPRPLWEKTNGKIAFRPGEVSLFCGANGHGKSMFLSQVEIDLMTQGERVLSLSFEMLPVRQMQRMARQAYASDQPPIDFLNRFHAWTTGKLWMYDHNGSIKWEKVIAVMRYAQEKFGITQRSANNATKHGTRSAAWREYKKQVNHLICESLKLEKIAGSIYD